MPSTARPERVRSIDAVRNAAAPRNDGDAEPAAAAGLNGDAAPAAAGGVVSDAVRRGATGRPLLDAEPWRLKLRDRGAAAPPLKLAAAFGMYRGGSDPPPPPRFDPPCPPKLSDR